MKNRYLRLILISLLVLLGAFLRLYRFVDLMNFSFGQGNALNLSAQMIKNRRPALISQQYVIRKTTSGHSFFHSGAYLYPLAPLQLLFNYDPLPITVCFALFNLFSAFGLFWILKKYFNFQVAVIALILFLFSPTMINYSRFIWHANLLIPIITLAIYFFLDSVKNKQPLNFLMLGILSGLGFGIHIGFVIPSFLFFLWTIYHSFKRHSFLYLPLFIIGVLIGDLPVVIFDLRNHFFNSLTMLEFIQNLGHGQQQGGFAFESYHFVSLYIPLFILISLFINYLSKRFSSITLLAIILYILICSPYWGLSKTHPDGMVEGWNYSGVKKAAQIINSDNPPKEYEVATIIDGETRSTALRYLLNSIHHRPPLGVTEYPQAKILYVIARESQDPINYNVWEISSLQPLVFKEKWLLQTNIYLYKFIPVKK